MSFAKEKEKEQEGEKKKKGRRKREEEKEGERIGRGEEQKAKDVSKLVSTTQGLSGKENREESISCLLDNKFEVSQV